MGKSTIKILAFILVACAAILIYIIAKQKGDDKKKKAEVPPNPAVPDPVKYPGINPVPTNAIDVVKAIIKPVADDRFPLIQGSKGKNVMLLQLSLNNSGASLKVDGAFGPATAAALKKKWGDVDGITEGEFNLIVFDSPVQGGMPVQFLAPIQSGSKGYWVQVLQCLLGIAITGTFADSTDQALRKLGYVNGSITVQQIQAIGRVKDPLAAAPNFGIDNYTFKPF